MHESQAKKVCFSSCLKSVDPSLTRMTSGSVFCWRRVVSPVGMTVALRAVTVDRVGDGLSKSTLRELKLLSQLRHPNIVRLLEIVRDKNADVHGSYDSPSGSSPSHTGVSSLLPCPCCGL